MIDTAYSVKCMVSRLIEYRSYVKEIHHFYCRLYTLATLAECIQRDSRVRVTRDETVRVRLFTLFPWALGFGMWHEATARRDTRPFDSEYLGPLKKRELMRRDPGAQGYTRASEVKQVFPSTFSLSHCLWFFRKSVQPAYDIYWKVRL